MTRTWSSRPSPTAAVAVAVAVHDAAAELDFEALFQEAPCGYLTTSDEGTITGVNDTFLHWTGHRRPDLLGRRLHELMPVGDRILYTTHSTPQLMVVGASTEILIGIIGADGARLAALLTAARNAAGDGVPAVVRVIIVSAHERRRYDQELVTSLRRAEAADSRRVSAEADLAHLALHDPLTGLPNRARITSYLDSALARRTANPASVGVLSINLDHFRAVNDSLGSAAGDELLRTVADRLSIAVRETGMVARVSGDGFVVVDDLAETGRHRRWPSGCSTCLTIP